MSHARQARARLGRVQVTNLQLSVVLICLHPICRPEMIIENLIHNILLPNISFTKDFLRTGINIIRS